MKKPPLDLKPGQVWVGYQRNGWRTRRHIAASDKTGVLWYRPGSPSVTYYSTCANFANWAERLLP
jgi:hypothetical protein